jgi:heme/copper-type cytochrome/quinol oxidase subunit 1
MGAVFALYSAWYFWIPKMLGLEYNRMYGKVHFWIFFIGVNVTFFPQHFLGLQGMPRRISDYPDAFAGWNLISSFGSIISVVATWLFLYIVYVQLVEGKATSRYPWLTPQFYSDILQTLLNRSYNSLEWALSSPPKPHAFVSLPIQSSFNVTVLAGTAVTWTGYALASGGSLLIGGASVFVLGLWSYHAGRIVYNAAAPVVIQAGADIASIVANSPQVAETAANLV